MARPDYEYLWRPAVEGYAAVGWAVAALAAMIFAIATAGGTSIAKTIALAASAMALLRAGQLGRLWITKARLASFRIDVVALDTLEQIVNTLNGPGKKGGIYMGNGFDVENAHAQRWYELRRLSVHEVTPPPFAMKAIASMMDFRYSDDPATSRAAWVDAVEANKRPIINSMAAQAGHTIVLGATGAGKTTYLILSAYQRAFMGDVVVVLDPKGDDGMERGLKEVARRLNRPFVLIDPARPSKSARLSLLANFNRYTELPSRIVSVLPESDFKAFGWCFTSRYVAGMLMVGEKPDIAKIKLYIQGGARLAADLLERCIEKWARDQGINPENMILPAAEGGKRVPRVDKLIEAYFQHSKLHASNDVIEGLVATYRHNDDHYQKITMNLVPVLEKLTAGELSGLFSPDGSDTEDTRQIWDTEAMVEQKAIVYFRLDSLSDSEVGSTMGSMFLSNLVAVAGARYNQGVKSGRVAAHIDELSEIANIPFIQLENKGRGALFDLTLFTQSIQDFTARFGSTAFRDMILGNANNLVSFRVSGKDNVDFVMERIGKTEIRSMEFSQSLNQRTDDNIAHFGGGVSRKVKSTEVDLFPRDLMSRLPNFHYLAAFQGGRVVKGVVPLVELPATLK